MKDNKIRGTVYARYNTVKNFAKDIGWGKGKAYRIVNGEQEMSAADVRDFCKFFELSWEEAERVFLGKEWGHANEKARQK